MFNVGRAGSQMGHMTTIPPDNPPEPYHDPPRAPAGFFYAVLPPLASCFRARGVSQVCASQRSMQAISSSVSTGLVT
jgi:hypothetical protein